MNANLGRRTARRTGFSLVELVTVVAILGILVALVASAAAGLLRAWRVDVTMRTLDALDTALRAYARDYNGLFPYTSTSGVMGQVHPDLRPVSGSSYDIEAALYAALTAVRRTGPYGAGQAHKELTHGSGKFTVFVDAWGRPIRYHPPKSGGKTQMPFLESEGPKPDVASDPASKADNLYSYKE